MDYNPSRSTGYNYTGYIYMQYRLCVLLLKMLSCLLLSLLSIGLFSRMRMLAHSSMYVYKCTSSPYLPDPIPFIKPLISACISENTQSSTFLLALVCVSTNPVETLHHLTWMYLCVQA